MGLDMYLTRNHYVRNWSHRPDRDYKVSAKMNNKSVPFLGSVGEVTSIREGVLCWRKANAIHKWFVDNVQDGDDDCGKYYVGIEQLQELRHACLAVIASPERAEELLPTQGGMFYGSTEFDEYYLEDLRMTAKVIEKLVQQQIQAKDMKHSMDFEYSSSW